MMVVWKKRRVQQGNGLRVAGLGGFNFVKQLSGDTLCIIILFKYIILCFLVYLQSCATITTKINPYPLTVTPHHFLSSASVNH